MNFEYVLFTDIVSYQHFRVLKLDVENILRTNFVMLDFLFLSNKNFKTTFTLTVQCSYLLKLYFSFDIQATSTKKVWLLYTRIVVNKTQKKQRLKLYKEEVKWKCFIRFTRMRSVLDSAHFKSNQLFPFVLNIEDLWQNKKNNFWFLFNRKEDLSFKKISLLQVI